MAAWMAAWPDSPAKHASGQPAFLGLATSQVTRLRPAETKSAEDKQETRNKRTKRSEAGQTKIRSDQDSILLYFILFQSLLFERTTTDSLSVMVCSISVYLYIYSIRHTYTDIYVTQYFSFLITHPYHKSYSINEQKQ